MKYLIALLLLFVSPAFAAQKPVIRDNALSPAITVIALYNGRGVPAGWQDSTTRPDATEICNKLIENQSKEYATPYSRSRCIIQVQE